MNLPSIGKVIIDALKEDDLSINYLKQSDFNKHLLELGKTYKALTEDNIKKMDALYVHNGDTILFNKDTKVLQEYVLLHEIIHAIRAQEKRFPRMKRGVKVHDSMKRVIMKASKATKTPSSYRTIFYKKAQSDILFWREEAIADCLSIFMCVEYGVGIKRSSIDKKRIVFVPLNYQDSYNLADKKKFVSNIRKECLLTLTFIMNTYVKELFDKKLVIKNFKNFFEEELEYCNKQIKKQNKKQTV